MFPIYDRKIPVTATRVHDGLTKRKGILASVVGTLSFEGQLEPWTHKPTTGGRPEMYRSKVAGVEVWLKGVTPPPDGSAIVGTIEVKLNEVTGTDGVESQYLYVNVLPLGDATPTATVSIIRPAKSGGVKVLPEGFDDKTDFVVDRHSEPWQVVLVRE